MRIAKRFILICCIALLLMGCKKEDEIDVQAVIEQEKAEKEQEEEERREKERKRKEEEERKEAQRVQEEEEQKEAQRAQEEEQRRLEEQQAAMNARGGLTIVLDPGHSAMVAPGTEPLGPGSSEYKAADASGTSGVASGVREYELTLNISVQLKAELEERGYTVLMTRESNDVPVSCIERANVANNAGAAAYVRIHANGSENQGAAGAMTICTTPGSPYASELYSASRNLSDCILNKYCEMTGCRSEGVWETDTMSGNNWSRVPVTIVEMGYMTNPQEDLLMQTPEYQSKIVQGIANGIDLFLGFAG
jgi:N-acetylmuramoyl-L-alanine amidase